MADTPTEGLDADGLTDLFKRQDGVVSRRQLLELGAADHDIRRMRRRRDLTTVHRGVFVNHTGALTRAQREWAAVLVHWPAALTLESALPKPPDDGPIHVAIDMRRTVRRVSGVVVHRTADFESRVQWVKSPPRVAFEHAVIDVAAARSADPLAMFRTLADACQSRRTSAARIAEVLLRRSRVPHKGLIQAMLDDLVTGACSVLEREYLHAVERRHGLPAGNRQKPIRRAGRSGYQDVDYEAYGVKVELDGRAFHDDAVARDLDAERDLDALVSEDACTVRLTYGLVFGNACRTAAKIAALLNRRGWPGGTHPVPRLPKLVTFSRLVAESPDLAGGADRSASALRDSGRP